MGDRPDVVIIGGGAGGLVAAAQVVLRGWRPLLLEGADRLGGRFSTIEKDGYLLPTGAIAIETGGPFFETFGELGIDPELRLPDPPVRIRVRGKELKAGAPMWDHMIKRVTKTAGKLADGIRRGGEGEDLGEMTVEQWARRYTRSKTLLSVFQTLSAAIFTCNADELSAAAFFAHLRETGGYKRFGYAPRGNVEIANKIAGAVVERGGEVRTGWEVTAIEVGDGKATAVVAKGPEGEERIETTAVISNVGPHNTARLLAGTSAADAFAERARPVRPTSMLALAFSTDEEVIEHPGILNFTDTRRLCSIANLGKTCPDLAPPGRTLYEAYSVPRPAVGGSYDVDAERKLLEDDLRDHVPDYDKADVILFKNMHGTSTPAQQCLPGEDIPVRTPLPNLVEVGDAVKPKGWIGTTACAQTARWAVDALQEDGVLA